MRPGNPLLLWAGTALLVAGAVLLAVTLLSGGPPSSVPLVGESQGQVEQPWPLWVILAGLMLAAGAAGVGIGMNRWRAH